MLGLGCIGGKCIGGLPKSRSALPFVFYKIGTFNIIDNTLQPSIIPTQVAEYGDAVQFVFNVSDLTGAPVLLTGAFVTLKFAPSLGVSSVFTATSLLISGNTVTCQFTTDQLFTVEPTLAAYFIAQLRITLAGSTLSIANVPLEIDPIIN